MKDQKSCLTILEMKLKSTSIHPHTFPYFTSSFTKWHNTIKVTEWRGLSILSAQLLTQHDWPLTLTLKYDVMMSSSSFKIKTFVKTCLLSNWKKELFSYQTFYNKYLVHLHFFILNYSSLLIHSKRPKFNLFALGMFSFLKFCNYVKVIIPRQGRGARNVGSSDQRASSSLVHKLAVSRAVT